MCTYLIKFPAPPEFIHPPTSSVPGGRRSWFIFHFLSSRPQARHGSSCASRSSSPTSRLTRFGLQAEISGAASIGPSSSANGAAHNHTMKIHFLVVGGSISGLASAIALCRAGHNVTVLDVEEEAEAVSRPLITALSENSHHRRPGALPAALCLRTSANCSCDGAWT